MTTIQVFQESLKTSVFGMCLVLGTLYILSLILELMRLVFESKTNVKKNETSLKDQTSEQIQTVDTTDDTELIVVITAAIAEYLQTPVSTFKIGTIRQIHEKTPIWGIESRIYNINNKF